MLITLAASSFYASSCTRGRRPGAATPGKPNGCIGLGLRQAIVSVLRRQVSWCFMGSPPPILQANISMADSLLLMVIALVVFGPRRLPLIGRQIGKLMYEFRKASNDFKFQMEEELRNSEEADRRKREEAERQQRLALAAQNQPAENSPAQSSAVATGADARPSEAVPSASATDPNSPAPEARPEEGYPRIAPPSTGE